MRFGFAFACLVLLPINLTAAHAAQFAPDPGAIQNNQRNVEEFYDRLGVRMGEDDLYVPASLVKESEPVSPAPERIAETADASFWVSRIRFSESRVIAPGQLSDLAQPYEKRQLSIAELNKLVDEINTYYRSRNFVTARAILPQQTVRECVVDVRLIEAKLDQILVADNRHTSERYIKQRLNLTEGSLADTAELQDALSDFNAINDVKLKALLQPGSEPYTTSYVVHATEPKNHQLSAFVDNAGRETIGEERIGLRYSINSLTGRRDRLSLGGSYADGADAAYFSYSVPINKYGTRAIVGFDYSQIVIVSGDLATFNVRGTSSVSSAYLSHPLQASANGSLFVTGGLNVKDSETDFDNIDRFESASRTLSFGAEYQHLGEGFLVYARPRLNAGFDDFSGDRSFVTLNGDAGLVIGFTPEHRLALRLQGQLSDVSELSATEQFQLGGVASVRGYPEGLLIGDQGYFVSAEYRYAGLSWGDRRHLLEPFVFADHGGVFTRSSDRGLDKDEYLSSLGFGFSYRLSSKLTTNFQVGFPLSSHRRFDDDYALHFHINYTPF